MVAVKDVAGPSSVPAEPPRQIPVPAATPSASIPAISSPMHLQENRDIQLRLSDGKGRGLFWNPSDGRRVGRGTTLMRLTPEVTVPSSDNLSSLCHKCFSPSDGGKALQRCSGCKVLRYCSTKCQKADWPSHRRECTALQALQKSSSKEKEGGGAQEPGMTLRLLGRLVWEHKRLGKEWWKGINNLQSNRDAIQSDENLMQLPLRLAYYLGATPDEQGKAKMTELGLPAAADVLDIISRTAINTIVVYSSDLSAIGVALSATAAMINHSCVPNVAIVYPNGPGALNPMHVVVIRDLDPGEELTTFYIDVADPYTQRQKILQQRYFFTCKCPLCKKSRMSRVDAREALWCGRQGCSGWVSSSGSQGRSLCTKCKQPRTVDLEEVAAAIQQGVQVLAKIDQMVNRGEWKEALSAARQTLKRLSELQPPSAYPLLSLLRQLQTACIMCATSNSDERESLQHFEEAIRLHFVSLAGMQASNGKVYSEGHPSRAIALATLSTLMVREASPQEVEWAAAMAYDSAFLHRVPMIPPIGPARDQAGISLMVQAIKELKIAYGNDEDGGEPGRKLIEQVRQWKENEALTAMAGNRAI
jgi:hypothetical protein